jgi:hypothetical protein
LSISGGRRQGLEEQPSIDGCNIYIECASASKISKQKISMAEQKRVSRIKVYPSKAAK